MERIENNQEENYEREQLPPLTLVHFDIENEEFVHEEQNNDEQKEEEKNSENIIEEQQVPHYIPFWEQLLSESILAIENISGVIVSEKDKEEVWAKKDKIKMCKVVPMSYPVLSIKKLLEDFALNIAKTEFLPKTIERSETLIKKLTRKIEDNDKSEGRISPKMRWSGYSKELFWSQDFTFLSLEQEDDQVNLQCLEIERLHLQCLEDFHDQLLTQQIQEQIRKRKESSESEENLSNKLEYEELKHAKLPAEIDVNNLTVEENFVIVKSFEDYLTEEGKKLLPFLKNKFRSYKPKDAAILLHALKDLNLLTTHPKNNITDIYKAMTNTFGKIGTRQGLNRAYSTINKASKKDDNLIKKWKIVIYKENYGF